MSSQSGMPHARERNTGRFPIGVVEGRRFNKCGWLTYTEYDILDMYYRLGIRNIYFHQTSKRKAASCDKLFIELVQLGILEEGDRTMFTPTRTAHLLYKLTDRFMLHYQKEQDARLRSTE